MRPSGRAADQLRPVSLELDVTRHAEGSCLVRYGDTHVLCTATVEERVPPFLRNKGTGWVTAEYGMLPRATTTRTAREAARGKQSGRTLEIQRLIGPLAARDHRHGRAGRAAGDHRLRRRPGRRRDPHRLDHRRLRGAAPRLRAAREGGELPRLPLREPVAAVSCGLVKGVALLDLDYAEDSTAEADANFVLSASGGIVEIQVTAEDVPIDHAGFEAMRLLAAAGIAQLVAAQRRALGIEP
jgi:ribonuclease PH